MRSVPVVSILNAGSGAMSSPMPASTNAASHMMSVGAGRLCLNRPIASQYGRGIKTTACMGERRPCLHQPKVANSPFGQRRKAVGRQVWLLRTNRIAVFGSGAKEIVVGRTNGIAVLFSDLRCTRGYHPSHSV